MTSKLKPRAKSRSPLLSRAFLRELDAYLAERDVRRTLAATDDERRFRAMARAIEVEAELAARRPLSETEDERWMREHIEFEATSPKARRRSPRGA